MNNQIVQKHWAYFALLAMVFLSTLALIWRSDNLKILMKPESFVPVVKTSGNRNDSDRIAAALKRSEKQYQSYAEKRRELVGGHPENVNPWNTEKNLYFWHFFLPTFACPYTTQRIGAFGDGGKWICGFELFERAGSILKGSKASQRRPCIVYSFGVASESSFENEFLNRTDCEIFAYDASVDKMGSQVAQNERRKRLHFEKLYISSSGYVLGWKKKYEFTLRQIMNKNGHQWIDFLKMDIEWAETSVLNQVMDDFETLPFGHFNLEVHVDQEGKLFPEIYKLWERMEEKGLRPFKSEMNHASCVAFKTRPKLAEYSFINIFGESRLIVPS